jgi:hypothetical protein
MCLAVRVRFVLLALSILAFAPSVLRAQAFVPSQGEGSVSVLYQDQFFKYHYSMNVPADIGPIYSRSILADVTYGLTDKLAVTVGLPWVATRYNGPRPHPLPDFSGPNPIDDGSWHSTAQDFRFDVRYNLTRNLGNKGIVMTPFIGSILPSHQYTYFAHSGFGRDLKELQTGLSVAKLFERGVPGLLLQATYAYGFTEQVLDISHNRSVFGAEAGYFVTPKLRLLALGSGQMIHGGVDFTAPPSLATLGPEKFLHHDQIERSSMFALGGGTSFSITDSMDVFGSLMHTVYQRSGHGLDRGITLGLSWTFTTSHAKARATGTTASNSLSRCLCEKGK